MSAELERLNNLPAAEAEAMLLPCCGSWAWVRKMAESRPFRDLEDLVTTSDRIWWSLDREDWLEAFAAHPKIGEKTTQGSARSRRWSEQEQAGARGVPPEILRRLSEGNLLYQQRFGHNFIVCATGKDAAEMLTLLRGRLANEPETELRIAAEEQRKITNLRLEKLLRS